MSQSNKRTPDPSVSKPTPLTNSIEETLERLIEQVMADDGEPLLKDELTYAEQTTQSIITKIKESLPEKKTGKEFDKLPLHLKPYQNGFNAAIDEMEDKLG